jgi:uncharacterized protein (TIGR02266 family)
VQAVSDRRTGYERRREQRHPYRVRAVLVVKGLELEAFTEDVSLNGLFLRLELPVQERWLVRIRLQLPPEGDELAVMCMAARLVPARDGKQAGVGFLLYAPSPADRKRWARFVQFAAENLQPAAVLEAPPPAPVRRRDPRHPAVLQVRLQSVDDVQLLYTRNVSKGGLFVATALEAAEGTPMEVRVIHPKSGEHFLLEAVVRWRASSGEPGLGLEFTGLTEQRREEFQAFIGSEIPVTEVAWVAGGDPGAARPAPPGPAEAAGFTRMAAVPEE